MEYQFLISLEKLEPKKIEYRVDEDYLYIYYKIEKCIKCEVSKNYHGDLIISMFPSSYTVDCSSLPDGVEWNEKTGRLRISSQFIRSENPDKNFEILTIPRWKNNLRNFWKKLYSF